jgi:hypothetical protein
MTMKSKTLYTTLNSKMYEINELIFNLFLMELSHRNMFQIYLSHAKSNNKIIKKIVNILDDFNPKKIKYKIFGDTSKRIIVYDNTFDIDDLDTSFGKKFGKQLGLFYKCASNNFKSYDIQIKIYVFDRSKEIQVPIYTQMCNKKLIVKNMDKFLNIAQKLEILFKKLNNGLSTVLEIRTF